MANAYTSILSLEYNQLINHNTANLYESNNGLWQGSNPRYMDNLSPLNECIEKLNSQSERTNNVQLMSDKQLMKLCIKGTKEYINETKAEILNCYNQINYKKIEFSEEEFLKINDYFIIKLNELSQYYQIEVIINNINTNFDRKWQQLKNYQLYLIGNQDNITIAETQVRILVDTCLNGFTVDYIELPLSLIPIIGGIEMLNFNEIVKQSLSNIYLPDLLPELFNSKIFETNKNLKIWITSENIYEIIMTKKILQDLIDSILIRENSLLTKEIVITKTKLDLLILYNQLEILNIMFKNGTFIQLPSLGENETTIKVQGQTPESINESIKEINLIFSGVYTLELLPITNQALNLMNDYYLMNLIGDSKTLNVSYNLIGGLSITGSNKEIKVLIMELINNGTYCQLTNFEMNLIIELDNLQKDFISGKKNGKIIKILNNVNQIPIISFHAYNEYNFFIKISINTNSNRFSNLLKVIELIELELPSELQFNIPEVFHKSIIGNGGSIIQSIMKKYNVFIKFSSSVILVNDDSIFYLFKRFNNVLIKCPMKNSKNIQLVKFEIDQLVNQCCLNNMINKSINSTIYQTIEFNLLKSHYLMIINKNYNLKFINFLEIENNSFINFPKSIDHFNNSNNLLVDIKGAELKIQNCANKLSQILPSNFEFKIPFCHGKFNELINESNKEFKENIIIPFRLMLGIELLINEVSIDDSSCHQIILSFWGKQSDKHIQMAINDLTLYLREKKFLIMDKSFYKFNPIKQKRQNILKPINYNFTPTAPFKFLPEIPVQPLIGGYSTYIN